MKAGGSTLEAPVSGGESRTREPDLMAALPARSRNREVKVGAFVLVGVVAFIVLLFSLTDVGTFRGRYYATTVIDNAGGMRNGDPVQMRGVNIGRVAEFEMVPEGVAVKMEIFNRYEIPEDSHVAVKSAGLLGGMVVDVVPGVSERRVSEDAILPGAVEQDIMGAATDLGTRADTVLTRAGELLSDQTINAVGGSAVELQALIGQLSALAQAQRQELALLTQSLRRSAQGVEGVTTGPELQRAVAHIDSLTLRLDETTRTLGSASTSLETVAQRLERGEGTLGRLTTDDTLYDNMNAAATQLRELIADIKANPRKYINVTVF
jgi:phospholipid/cholesterol/gamma-HCH transport system substrate-binding protein